MGELCAVSGNRSALSQPITVARVVIKRTQTRRAQFRRTICLSIHVVYMSYTCNNLSFSLTTHSLYVSHEFRTTPGHRTLGAQNYK